jgi:AsmA family/AsmA-like C-terminal region
LDPESGSAPPSQQPSWTHWLILSLVLLIAAAVVLPPLFNISRYKRRIATSISTSIGRPVHMSTVRLHLLPRPGFEIADFEVEEDPAFGDEPMLRSASVVASIRLTSLWRGRLEMGRISFGEPSLNLVRDAQGRWNFDSVLLKASQSEIAPTVQSRPGAALRFPYIDGTNARINFKQGYEKQPLSFLNSDVAVWLDKPEEWRLRVEAQPARTDLDLALSDTGIVLIDGTFLRAAELERVPMTLHAEWTKAPLGQLSRMLAGRDRGWRGDLDVRADITGTAANAQVKARIRANGVHRLEFVTLEPLDMDATCQGHYLSTTSAVEDLSCVSPIGNGKLMIAGAVHSISTQPQPDLKVHMEKVPVAAVLESLRSLRNDFAPSLQARGSVDGDFRFGPQQGFPNAILDGYATVNSLELTSSDLEKPLLVPQLKLATTGKAVPISSVPSPVHHGKKHVAKPVLATTQSALVLQPFSLTGAGPAPLMADGRFTADRFAVHLSGSATVKDLVAIGKSFGFLKAALTPLAPQGAAEINLTIRGPWLVPVTDTPIPVDSAEGTLQVTHARIAPAFLPLPVDVISASATFSSDQVDWEPLAFDYAGLQGEGAFRYRIPCVEQNGCDAHFDLRFSSLNAAKAEAALLGGSGLGGTLKELLARLDNRSRPWPKLSGTISAGTLNLGELAVQDARASVAIEGNHLQIESLDGRVLGGTLDATGALDASGNRPHYALDVEVTKANAADLAEIFHEKWGSGQLNLKTHLDLTGYTQDEIASSAKGNFHWDWTHGSLTADSASDLARFDRWQAGGVIADKLLTLENSTFTHGKVSLPVTGSISFDRGLKLSLGEPSDATLVTGSAQKPHMSPPTIAVPVKRSMRTSP